MTALGHSRGHTIAFDGGCWRYRSDGVALDDDPTRPCARCGRPPTPEGHDACLGRVDGVSSACCGHGVSRPWSLCVAAKRGDEHARHSIGGTDD